MADIAELARQGGWVLGLIVVVSIAAWTVIVYEWLALGARGRNRRGLCAKIERLARAHDDRDTFGNQAAALFRSEVLLRRRSLRTVAMLAAAMPLLGLLGTVLGMTQTFSAFTSRGAPEARALADGISQALITTQAGLVATAPVLLARNALAARVRRYLDAAERLVIGVRLEACGLRREGIVPKPYSSSVASPAECLKSCRVLCGHPGTT